MAAHRGNAERRRSGQRAERLTALRRDEHRQMQEYVGLPFGEHMGFLISALDGDPSVVSNAGAAAAADQPSTRTLVREAVAFLAPHQPADRAAQAVARRRHAAIRRQRDRSRRPTRRSPARRCASGATPAGVAWSGKASIRTAVLPTSWLRPA